MTQMSGNAQGDNMNDMIKVDTAFFRRPGPGNTDKALKLAHERAAELGILTAVVATTTGETGVLAAQRLIGMQVIVVTHSTGFQGPDIQELTPDNRAAIESAGGRILTCQHTLGGVGRAIRKKLGTYQVDEIIAHTLRIWGEGTKVVAEIVLMAADAGLIRTDTPVVAIGGTGRGADTAAIILPTNAQTFFDLKILEVLCRPCPAHPAFAP
jgi:hypothetical protein